MTYNDEQGYRRLAGPSSPGPVSLLVRPLGLCPGEQLQLVEACFHEPKRSKRRTAVVAADDTEQDIDDGKGGDVGVAIVGGRHRGQEEDVGDLGQRCCDRIRHADNSAPPVARQRGALDGVAVVPDEAEGDQDIPFRQGPDVLQRHVVAREDGNILADHGKVESKVVRQRHARP